MRLGCCVLVGALWVGCGATDSGTDASGPDVADVFQDAGTDVLDVPMDPGVPDEDGTEVDGTTDPGADTDPMPTDPGHPGELPDIPGFPYEPGEPPAPGMPAGPVPAAHPAAFARVSSFTTLMDGPVTLDRLGFLGALGTGNGHVFGQVGLATPLNTLHSLVGPTYERRPNFFGDYAITLAPVGGEPLAFEQEWAGRSLSAPVVFTEGSWGSLILQTIDFAGPADEEQARYCFVRMVTVRNVGMSDSGEAVLRVTSHNRADPVEDGVLVETSKARSLTTRFVQPGGVATSRMLEMPLGVIEAGSDRVLTLLHCAAQGAGPVATPAGDPGDWLDALAQTYGAWDAGLVQVDVPEPWVKDFLDGMKMTLKVQTAATGATCPMSEYTRTWARDNIGPVMAMLALGGHEDVEGMLDYLYAAIRYNGDLRNSYDADLDPANAPPPRDWESLPTLPTKESAETPSYMVIMYGLHHRYTGSLERAVERWGLLRRCMYGVAFGPDHLLSFTGDETFRAAMNAAFGLFLEHPHHEQSWSANSSALWLGAGREFERLAAAQGLDDQVTELRAMFADVEASTVTHYLGEDGCLASFIDRQTMAVFGPWEDVSLQVTWSGWKDGDDPVAEANMACLVERLGREPGVLQSPLHPDLIGVFEGGDEGVYTGMLPGYTLAALTDVGHPDAGAALDAVRRSLDTSGNLHEYMLFEDRKGLSLVYDPVGTVGDYTAKFRPWEGGIVAEAVLRYLIGLRPDAVASTLDFRPHLPDGWDRMAFSNLRVGQGRYDLEVVRDGVAVVVTVTSRAATDAVLTVRWDAGGPTPSRFEVDGEPVDGGYIARFMHFGQASDRTPAIVLPAGGAVVVRILPDAVER